MDANDTTEWEDVPESQWNDIPESEWEDVPTGEEEAKTKVEPEKKRVTLPSYIEPMTAQEYFNRAVPIAGSAGSAVGKRLQAAREAYNSPITYEAALERQNAIENLRRKHFEQENPAAAAGLGFGAGLASPGGVVKQMGISAVDALLDRENADDALLAGGVTGAIGGAMKGVGKALAPAAEWAGKKAKQYGIEQAWDALSSGQKKLQSLDDQTDGFVPREAGQFALESGSMKPGVGTSWENVTKNLVDAEEKSRAKITKLVDDMTAANAGNVPLSRVLGALRSAYNEKPKVETASPFHRRLASTAKQLQLDYGKRGYMTQREIQNLKNQLQPDYNELRGQREAQQEIRGILSSQQNRGVEEGKELLGKGFEDTKNLAENYSALKTAELGALNAIKGATERKNRISANRVPSLTDYITGTAIGGGVYAGSQDPETALAVGAATLVGNRYLRNRMQQAVAANSYAIGKMLQGEGRYGGILRKALERGQANLGLTHVLLMERDPFYRAEVQSLEGTQP